MHIYANAAQFSSDTEIWTSLGSAGQASVIVWTSIPLKWLYQVISESWQQFMYASKDTAKYSGIDAKFARLDLETDCSMIFRADVHSRGRWHHRGFVFLHHSDHVTNLQLKLIQHAHLVQVVPIILLSVMRFEVNMSVNSFFFYTKYCLKSVVVAQRSQVVQCRSNDLPWGDVV